MGPLLRLLRTHALPIVLGAALLLRLAGSGFGAPAHVHPDEVQYMPTALGLAANRTMVPADYHNPHLLTNICLLVVATAFAALKTLGITPDAAAFGAFVWNHTFGFLLLARWLSAVFGAATVWLTYDITRRMGDRTAALSAAATIGVSFLHVRDSHFATNDVLMTMLVTAAVLASITCLDRPSLSRVFATGVLAGAAFGAKYTGVIAIASAAAAMLWTNVVRERRPGRLVSSALATAVAVIIGFVVTNPAALVAPRHVLTGFLLTSAMGLETFCCQRPEPVPWQMAQTLVLGTGAVASAAALWGLVAAMRSKSRPVLLITLATPFAYLLVMAGKDVFAARFLLLVLPFVAVCAGLGASDVIARCRRLSNRSRRGLALLSVVMLLAEPLARSVYLDVLLTRLDDRRDVENWLRARPGALEHAVFDGPAAAGFATALPATARVLRNAELSREDPAALLPPGTRYVVLSNLAMSPEFSRMWQFALEHGVAVFEVSPYRTAGRTPLADDLYAPLHALFEWSRPGVLVRVFELQR